jgi:hypothetical protein
MQITVVEQKKNLLPFKIQVDSYRFLIAESKYINQTALSATYVKEKGLISKLCL